MNTKPSHVLADSPQDIYALGYVAWEIYHESLAYSNYSESKIQRMKFEDVNNKNNVPLPLDMQIPWIDMIKSCWYFDPKLRFNASQLVKSFDSLKIKLDQVIREDGNSRLLSTDLPSKLNVMSLLKEFLKKKGNLIFANNDGMNNGGIQINKNFNINHQNNHQNNQNNNQNNNQQRVLKKRGSKEKRVPRQKKNSAKSNDIVAAKSEKKKEDQLIDSHYLNITHMIAKKYEIDIDDSFPFSQAKNSLVSLDLEIKSLGFENIGFILLTPKDFEKISDHLGKKLNLITFTSLLNLLRWIEKKIA